MKYEHFLDIGFKVNDIRQSYARINVLRIDEHYIDALDYAKTHSDWNELSSYIKKTYNYYLTSLIYQGNTLTDVSMVKDVPINMYILKKGDIYLKVECDRDTNEIYVIYDMFNYFSNGRNYKKLFERNDLENADNTTAYSVIEKIKTYREEDLQNVRNYYNQEIKRIKKDYKEQLESRKKSYSALNG